MQHVLNFLARRLLGWVKPPVVDPIEENRP